MAGAPQSRPADGREGRATPAAVLALPLLGAACLALVATLRAQVPDWWLERGFISTNAPVATDDFAPANQGQVKHSASIAAQELEAKLPGGAGINILSMVAGWTNNTSGADDFAPLNLGQLKAVAAPFYQRFSGLGILTNDYPWTAGLSNGYPWTGGSDAKDFAVANIGQIKFAFAFDLSPWNSDDDHLPDAWEQAHFGAGNLAQGDTGDPDGDGIPNIGEYLGTSDPTNVFSGAGAAIFVVAGDGQAGSTNRFLAGPLVVGATNSLGPLVGASLEFSVDLGDGLLSATNAGSGLTNPIALATGPDGTAPAWLRFGSIDFLTNRVTVSAGGLAPLTFLALLDDGDLDQDGLPDAWEAQIVGALPNDPITDIRHVHPGDDFDADTLDNAGEFGAGTNPVDPDSDGDAIPDGWEHRHGSDPLAADSEGDADRDGITNLIEYRLELNLVAWYRLDGDGTDSSTNHLDAPADGAVPTQDRFGAASAALYFNGGVVYQTNGSAVVTNGVDLEVTNSVVLNLSTTHQRTISLWFNAARFLSLTNQVLWEEGANVRGINIYLHGDRLLAGAYNTNKNESGWPGNWIDMGPVQTGRWYHVALVLNASNAVAPDALRAYLDGQYMGNAPGSQIWAHSGLIGAAGMRGGAIFHDGYVGGNGRRFKGSLDEIRIYRRALTAEEVAALSPDADMDGLPDRWEQALVDAEPADGIETIRDLLPEDDFDFDGVPNRVEYKLSLNLAAWYPLDGDGTDLSGNGLDATAVGAVAAGDRFGRGGASLAFDGATGVLEGTNSSWINLGVHARHTVSLWFNADRITGGTSRQVLWEQGNATKGLNIYLSNSWVFAGAWNRDASQSDWDGDWLSGGPIATGTWHHVALVLDGGPTVSNGALRASLDGASLGDAPGSQLWPHSGLIGAAASRGGTRFNLASTGSDGHRLQGRLDEIRIYNGVPDDEILAALGPDVDQDGMADTWEQPFVDSLPNDPMRTVREFLPEDDFDGDGLTNIEEYHQARDLGGCWKFDEGSGTSAADGSGWGAHGTLSGGAAWTSGAMGGAVSLDGADDRVTVPHGAGIDLGAGGADFSVAFWINLRAGATGNWRAVMHKGAANMDRTFGIWMRPEGNSLHARVSTTASQDEGIDASSPIPVGAWTHVALVKAGGSLRLYINGALDREQTLAGATVSNTGALAIGDDDWSDATACWIDEVRVYGRALPEEEIVLLGPDVDQDGMPDAWERTFADADPEDGIEGERDFHPDDDFDLDGVLNLDEFRLGLDLGARYALDGDGADSSGNGLGAALSGWAPGTDRAGQTNAAVAFNGTDGLLAVPDSPLINGGIHGARTVSLWFNADLFGETSGHRVLWGEGDTNRGLGVYLAGDRLFAGGWNRPATESGWDPGDWVQSGPLSTGRWYHVALILEAGATVSNGAMRALLDGQELGRVPASQLWPHAAAGAAAMRDGLAFHDADQDGEGARFEGGLDELRIYNRALGQSEAAALGPDADMDGMADEWERQLVDADPGDAIRSIRDLSPDDDFDGDGIPNGIEYRLGLGLAAWYPLDGNGEDASGNGLDATLAGAVAATDRAGNAGAAVDFDGVLGLLSVPDSGRINGGIHGARTVSLWFNADLFGETSGHRVLWGEGDTNRGLGVYLAGDRLFAGGWNRPTTESGWDPGDWVQSGPLSTGRWYHVALVLDGGPAVSNGAIRVQLDGLALGEAPGSQIWPHGPAGAAAMRDGMAFHDGDESGEGARFQGRLDDIRVYDRALAPEEAAALVPDADQDGLPDGWEARLVDADPNDAIRDIWGLLPGDDFDGDGTSNLGEYGGGSDAADYFNGAPFLLAVDGGDGQAGYRHHFLEDPFSVLVTTTNGVALSNAPVAFAALDPDTSSVAGRHDPSGLAASMVARTDGEGRAIAYGYLQNAPAATNRFTARASGPAVSTNLEFTAFTRTDLVGDWRFSERDGGTTADESGFGNHGTLMGAIERMPGDGVDPGALFYDGENSWVRVPRAGALDPAGELTIAAWVKIGNDSTNRFYRLVSRKEHWADQTGYELEYNPYQKRLTFCGRGAEQLVAYDVDLGLGQWRHVAVTLSASTESNRYDGTFYVDGKPLAQYTVPEVPGFWRTNVPRVAAWPASPYWGGASSNSTLSGILPSALPLGLGRDPALRNDNLKGLLDDVRLYGRGLSAEEIHRLWFIDNDADGLLDTWEMNYFGDIDTTDGQPNQNFDRDEFSDRQEHDNGTDPTDYYNGTLPETDPYRSASMAVGEADLAAGVPLTLQIFREQGGTNAVLANAPVFFALEPSGTEIQGTNTVKIYAGRLSLTNVAQATEFGARAPVRTDENGVATLYFSATDALRFATNAPVTVSATIVAGDRMKVVEYHLAPHRGEIGYWPMDQRIGWIAPDATGNGHHGYYNKTNPDWRPTQAALGGSLQLYGGDDAVYVLDTGTGALELSGDISMAAWVYPTRGVGDPRFGNIFSKGDEASGFRLVANTNGVSFLAGGTNALNTAWTPGELLACPGELLPNRWHYVALTYAAAAGKFDLYIDGANVGTTTVDFGSNPNHSLPVNGEDLLLGMGFEGMIDEVRVISGLLSAEEIQETWEKLKEQAATFKVRVAFKENSRYERYGEWTMSFRDHLGHKEEIIETGGIDWEEISDPEDDPPKWRSEKVDIQLSDPGAPRNRYEFELELKDSAAGNLYYIVEFTHASDPDVQPLWIPVAGNAGYRESLKEGKTARWRFDAMNGDEDGDYLSDFKEFKIGTDPFDPDTDGDGMDDAWEVDHGLDPRSAADAAADPDGDGHTNLEEYQADPRTDPLVVDPFKATDIGTTAGSFSVTPSGQTSYSIPVTVSPGTAGMAPKLTLSYTMKANSVLGVGWAVSGMSAVSRTAATMVHDGFVDGVDFDGNDRFALDGQRLIGVTPTVTGALAEYRTEIDTFTRVAAYGTDANNPDSFKAWTKAGLIYTYGTATSGWAAGGADGKKLTWAVKRIEDQNGNYIDFSYQHLDSGGNTDSEFLVSQIDYTGNDAQSLAPYASVVFNYEDAPEGDRTIAYLKGRVLRNTRRLASIVSSFQSQEVRRYSFTYDLSEITGRSLLAYVQESVGQGTSGRHLAPTQFKWTRKPYNDLGYFTVVDWGRGEDIRERPKETRANGGVVRMHPSLDENPDAEWIAGDFNNDALTDMALVERTNDGDGTRIRVYTSDGGRLNESPAHWYDEETNCNTEDRWIPGDFNSDGWLDIVQVHKASGKAKLRLFRNDRAGHFVMESGEGWDSTSQWRANTFFNPADFNGDGRLDIVKVAGTNAFESSTDVDSEVRIDVMLNTGTNASGETQWSRKYKDDYESKFGYLQSLVADFTGDGLPDLMNFHYDNPEDLKFRAILMVNNTKGAGLQGVEVLDLVKKTILQGQGCVTNYAWTAGDVNGDGMTDLIRLETENNEDIRVYQAIGGGNFASPRTWGKAIKFSAESELKTGDFNGDGKADLLVMKNSKFNGYVKGVDRWIYYSTGTSFKVGERIKDVWTRWEDLSFTGDYNGDGKEDMLRVNGHGDFMMCSTGQMIHDVITEIEDGMGRATKIAYATLATPVTQGLPPLYELGAGDGLPPGALNTTAPIPVVRAVTRPDGIGGEYVVNYRYGGLRVHPLRGLLGFRWVEADDTRYAESQTTTTWYQQEFPYTGMPEKTVVLTPGGATNSLSETHYQTVATAVSGGTIYAPYAGNSVETTFELDGSQIVSVTNSISDYDAYGNPGHVEVADSGGFRKITESTYAVDLDNWRVSKLTGSTVTHQAPGWPDVVRTAGFAYDAGNGQLSGETSEPGSTAVLPLSTDHRFDAFGNTAGVRSYGPDHSDPGQTVERVTSTAFDALGRLPVAVTNALDHVETRTYYAHLGAVQSVTGPNNLTTTYAYDAFGRQTGETRPDNTSTATSWFYAGEGAYANDAPALALWYVVTQSSGSAPSVAFKDALDRTIRSVGFTPDNQKVYQDTTYDNFGRVATTTRPYLAGSSSPPTITTEYDVLGRVTKVTTPQAGATFAEDGFVYAGLTTTETNALGQVRVTVKDTQKRVVSVQDHARAYGGDSAFTLTTSYAHDAAGNLREVTTSDGSKTRARSMTYDLLGRKTAMTDPDMGDWTYAYDVFGEMVSQTDARNVTTETEYDALGRVVGRSDPDHVSAWVFDTADGKGVGKLHYAEKRRVSDNSLVYREEAEYDSFGRPVAQTESITNQTFTVTQAYDDLSRVQSITYPRDGFTVTNAYDSATGALREVWRGDIATTDPLWRGAAYNADGNLTQERLGNDLVTDRVYVPETGRIAWIRTEKENLASHVQSEEFYFDALGNLTRRTDYWARITEQQTLDESYTYDDLNRLRAAGAQSFAYDAFGNLTNKVGQVQQYGFGTGGDVRPHALRSVSGGADYVYDANGNLTDGGGRSLAWSAANLPTTITRGSIAAEWEYDCDNARILFRQTDGTDTTTTLYAAGGLFEHITKPDASVEHRFYVMTPAGRSVVHVQAPGGSNARTRWLHADHLGSITAISDGNGACVERVSFEAWGDKRALYDPIQENPQSKSTTRGFTGHEMLDALGLVHMNGRIYDPGTGRFLSPDPFVQFPDFSQSYNRYSYVLNNPLSFTDPTGYFLGGLFRAIGSFLGADGSSIFSTVLGGAAAMVLSPFIGPIAAGAVGGFLSGSLNAALNGADFASCMKGGMMQAGIGALTAGVGSAAIAIGQATGNALAQYAFAVVGHAAVQGGYAELMGGDFLPGALAGAAATAIGGGTGFIKGMSPEKVAVRTAIAGIAGGTAAEIGGGKFANGAMSGVFVHLFNDEAHNAIAEAASSPMSVSEFRDRYGAILEAGEIDIQANIYQAKRFGWTGHLKRWIDKVQSGGDWDYKDSDRLRSAGFSSDLLDEFGNVHFGMVARAYGFNLETSMYGAGLYQAVIKSGGNPNQLKMATILQLVTVSGYFLPDQFTRAMTRAGFTWGDNRTPRGTDAINIMMGWDYAKEHY